MRFSAFFPLKRSLKFETLSGSRLILNKAIEEETAKLGRSGLAFDLMSTGLQRMRWFRNGLHEETFFVENVIAMEGKERLTANAS